LNGLRVLITGASQGIGEALAEEAAFRKARVVTAARSQELLDGLAERVRAKGGTIEVVRADVTLPDDRQRMLDACVHHFSGLDVLINNAGVGATGHYAEASPERLRQIFEVNLFGTTETTRVCLPELRKGTTPAIVNISSVLGKRGVPARSEYCASKFAIQGFSEALRAELAKDGIDVLVVNPGLTQTNFSKNMLEQKALERFDHLRGMSSADVARATVRALERGRNEITLTFKGQLIMWVNRIAPRLVDFLTAKRVRGLFREEMAERRAQRAKGGQSPAGVR
jgi:short-subunit dehydrogenase